MILEICASNYQSAVNAEKAGADRIELCSELAVGGITPSYGLLKKTMAHVNIPVFVLIRPRSGNFAYSDAEFEIMKKDIELCKNLGCSGIVSGVLNEDHTIDEQRTQELQELSKPMKFTFHRAFDWTPNPFEALNVLKEIKVDRILTSGQHNAAEKGILILQQLLKLAGNDVIIMPGSGINPSNALIFKGAGFKELHCSSVFTPEVPAQHPLPMNSPKFLNDGQELVSNYDLIKSVVQLVSD